MTVKLVVYSTQVQVFGVVFGSQTETAIRAITYHMAQDYEKDPLYLYGKWDGKVHLLERGVNASTHTFPTGLLARVLAKLDDLGEPYEVKSLVPPWKVDPALAYLKKQPISVRKYQTQSVVAAMRGYQLDYHVPRRGGVLQIATGGGKTRTAARTIQLMQNRTVFLVDQTDLMHQTAREFEALLGCPIGIVGDGKCDIRDITVCTVQTVALAAGFSEKQQKPLTAERNAAIRKMMRQARVVIFDECHTCPAATARAALGLAQFATCVVGLSASPWRDDGLDLLIEAMCGPVVKTVTATELIDQGFLTRPEIVVEELEKPASKRYDGPDFNRLYKAWVVDDHRRTRHIAQRAQERIQAGDTVLILVKLVEHGKAIADLVPGAVFVEGKVSTKKRTEIFQATRDGAIRCVVATSVADKGLDIPTLSALILAGGGKSSTKALQRIGRVLRPQPGKAKAWVYDLVDNHDLFKRHFKQRLKIYGTEPGFQVTRKTVALIA